MTVSLREFYRKYAFTIWVLVFVAASMARPDLFRSWFGTDLKVLIVPLIQIITFGMGTTLSGRDFKNVLTMPGPVLIGIGLQFTIMPLAGFAIAMAFGFPPEVAAGLILIGSVSSGVASNVMTYLAGGNVPLSVTITACATILSTLITPFWMKTLAGRFIPVPFEGMMLSIFNMIIIPIVAGLAAHRLLYGERDWAERKAQWTMAGFAALASAGAVLSTPASAWGALIALKGGIALGFILLGLTILAKLIITLGLRGPANWMDKVLPVISMAGICLIIAVITAQSRDQLLSVGPLLILAAALLNGLGYGLGYGSARLARLDERASRAIAMEVGLKNGGMASGLAIDVLKSTSVALAPAIFGPWMNISGSLLAGWWRRQPVKAASDATAQGGATQKPKLEG